MMDYGSLLKASRISLINKSIRYKKQPAFHKSNRQIRGAIVSFLLAKKVPATKNSIVKNMTKTYAVDTVQVEDCLCGLVAEGMLTARAKKYSV